MNYVDVRGPWPTLIMGYRVVTLYRVINRGITVDDAIWIVENTPELINLK